MRTVKQVVLHGLCWGRWDSVRASSWLLLLYIVTWSSLKAAMPPCLLMPLIRINDVDTRCVHFFQKKLYLMPAQWTNPTRRRRQSPDIPPQLVSLLCTRHFLSFFLSGVCDVGAYEFMWTSSDFFPPSAMFTAWWNKTAWRWEMCCAEKGQTTSVKIVPEILLTTYLGVLYCFILWIIT